MADIEWLLDQIAESEPGPHVAAFFDFDGTLIDGYSAGEFFKERLRHGDVSFSELVNSMREAVNVERRGADISKLMKIAVANQAGQTIDEINSWATDIFARKISSMLYPEARDLVQAHHDRGHTVVVASSATLPQIESAAADLGIPHIVCTQIEIDADGKVTGKLSGPIRWGKDKAAGVKEFGAEHGIDMAASFAYSNGSEDVPFLESTGHAIALNPDKELAQVARKKDWSVGYLHKPVKTKPLDLFRTGAAVGALGGGLVGGGLMGLIKRNRQDGANFIAKVGTSSALAAAGISLNVVGEENAWSDRPAVFLFNHQSQLDPFVLGAVLEKDFTGVAKKQLQKSPVFAPLGYIADVAYIDRANRDKAIQQLEPVVRTLQNGRSIVISPEGTRSPTPRLLPFKKGPFHIAMQAGVPVIPFIMRNCGELMPAHSNIIHPGTLDVAVLPPVSTKDWDTEHMDEQVQSVRDMFLATLKNWPPAA